MAHKPCWTPPNDEAPPRQSPFWCARGERIGILPPAIFATSSSGTRPSATLADTAHFNLVTTDAGDYLFNALLTATRHNIQRVVVCRKQPAHWRAGTVDLLSYFSNHSHPDCPTVRLADSLDTLKAWPHRSTGWWACCPATA